MVAGRGVPEMSNIAALGTRRWAGEKSPAGGRAVFLCLESIVRGVSRGFQQGIEEGGPLGVEGGAFVVGACFALGFACSAVPVVGVPVGALLAVEVGVDGHGVGGLEFVDEGVGAGPVTARVPPQGFEGRGQVGRRGRGGERGGEGGGGHRDVIFRVDLNVS